MSEEIDLTRLDDEATWERKVQEACETRLEQCMTAYWHREEEGCGGECKDEPNDPSCAPFDGCDTCVVREILDAAWPFMAEASKKGWM